VQPPEVAGFLEFEDLKLDAKNITTTFPEDF